MSVEDSTVTGQRCSLVSSIRGILRGYTGEETVFCEMLQNAQDAKAKKVAFLLDSTDRTSTGYGLTAPIFEISFHSLLDSTGSFLDQFLGPSLIIYNSSIFTERDKDNIMNLGDSMKKDDPLSVGRFGLGFNCSYHLSDCPQLLSNGSFIVFDPLKYSGEAGRHFQLGPARNQKLVPYLARFHTQQWGQGSAENFQGTAFRLPLRQKALPLTQEHLSQELFDYEKLYRIITEQIRPHVSDYLLFMDNVEQIEFLVIPPGRQQVERLFSVEKSVVTSPGYGSFQKYCDQVARLAQVFETYREQILLGEQPQRVKEWSENVTWRCQTTITTHEESTPREEKQMDTKRYLVEHTLLRKGSAFSVALANTNAGPLLPRISVALPLDLEQEYSGRTFCCLPLPIFTNLPAEINGFFELGSNRREFCESKLGERWNSALLSAICHSYCQLLFTLKPPIDTLYHYLPRSTLPRFNDLSERILHALDRELHLTTMACVHENTPLHEELTPLLTTLGMKFLPMTQSCFRILADMLALGDCQPAFVRRFLRSKAKQALKVIDYDHCLPALAYCCHSLDFDQRKELEGLPVIPLLGRRVGIMNTRTMRTVTPSQYPIASFLPQLEVLDPQAFENEQQYEFVASWLPSLEPRTFATSLLKYLKSSDPVPVSHREAILDYVLALPPLEREVYRTLPIVQTTTGFVSLTTGVANATEWPEGLKQEMEGVGLAICHPHVIPKLGDLLPASSPEELIRALQQQCPRGSTQPFSDRAFQYLAQQPCPSSAVKYVRKLPLFAFGNKPTRQPLFHEAKYIHEDHQPAFLDDQMVRYNSKSLTEQAFLQSVRIPSLALAPYLVQRVLPHPKQFSDEVYDQAVGRLLGDEEQLKLTWWQGSLAFVRNEAGQLCTVRSLVNRWHDVNQNILGDSPAPTDLAAQVFPHLQWERYHPVLSRMGLRPLLSCQEIETRVLEATFTIPHAVALVHHLLALIDTPKGSDIMASSILHTTPWVPHGDQLLAPTQIVGVEQSPFASEVFQVFYGQLSKAQEQFLCRGQVTFSVLLRQNEALQQAGKAGSVALTKRILSELTGPLKNPLALWTADWEAFVPASKFCLTPGSIQASEDFPMLPQAYREYPRQLVWAGVPEQYSMDHLLSILKQHQGHPLSPTRIREVIVVLEELTLHADFDARMSQGLDLYAPNAEGQLVLATTMAFDNMPWSSSREQARHTLTHKDVSLDLAKRLHVQMQTERVVKQVAQLTTLPSRIGVPFGQQVRSLLQQLKATIDHDYVLGDPLFFELMQNADDAQATEIEFMISARSFPTLSLLDPILAEAQGPALYSYNNALFTEDDLASIRRVGDSLKKKDPAKTGNFGMGWNIVYHLTDLPSFVSGAHWVVMDPHARLAGGQTGILVPLQALQEYFPDQLRPFVEMRPDLFTEDRSYCQGTLFRFPLRMASHQSELSKKVLRVEDLTRLMRSFWQCQPYRAMLFARHLHSCQFHGEGEGEGMSFHVRLTLQQDESVREEQELYRTIAQGRFPSPPSRMTQKKITLVGEGESLSHHFYVLSGTADDALAQEELAQHQAEYGDYKFVPYGAVAMRVDEKGIPQAAESCQLFCTFPLTHPVHLPFLLNARVIPSSNRRELRKRTPGEEEPAGEWNELLLSRVIAPLYHNMIRHAQQVVPHQPSQVYSLWPVHLDRVDRFLTDHLCQPVLQCHQQHPSIRSRQGTWRPAAEVFFTTPEIPEPIISLLEKVSGLMAAEDVPEEIIRMVNVPAMAGPEFLWTCLANTSHALTHEEARDALNYLVASREGGLSSHSLVSRLMHLPVVPTWDGRVVPLCPASSSHENALYVVNEMEAHLLSHHPSCLVAEQPWTRDSTLVENGTNVYRMTPSHMATLLEDRTWDHQSVALLWKYLLPLESLEAFERLPIVPVFASTFQLRPLQSGVFQGRHFLKHESVQPLLPRIGLTFFNPAGLVLHPLLESYLKRSTLSDIVACAQPTFLSELTWEQVNVLRTFLISLYDPEDAPPVGCLQSWRLFEYYRAGDLAPASQLRHRPPMTSAQFSAVEPILRQGPLPGDASPLAYCQCRCLETREPLCTLAGFPEESSESFWTRMAHQVIHLPSSEAHQFCREVLRLNHVPASLGEIAFVPSLQGKACAPVDLLDPRVEELKALIKSPSKFPSEEIDEQSLAVLRGLGLQRTLSDQALIQCAKRLAQYDAEINDWEDYQPLALALRQHLTSISHQEPSRVSSWKKPLGEIAWVMTMKKPSDLPHDLWHAQTLSAPQDMCTMSSHLWGVRPVLPAEADLKLFVALGTVQEASLSQLDEKLGFLLDSGHTMACEMHYRELLEQIDRLWMASSSEALLFFQRPWILTPRGSLVSPSQVVREETNLAPYLYTLPEHFHKYPQILGRCGIPQSPSKEQLIAILHQLDQQTSTVQQQSLPQLVTLVTSLALKGDLPLPLPILTVQGQLMPSTEVIFDDINWMEENISPTMGPILHPQVSGIQVRRQFQIRTARQAMIETYDAIGEPYGQRAELCDRIREILREYPETSVPTEFLQNADDAQAVHMAVMIDETVHDATRILDDRMQPTLTQPAVMFYNDSLLSHEDFHRIVRVGSAGKRTHAHQTGQFGLGSVSMYHYTDCPMIISGDYFCVFDPLLAYVPAASSQQPGRKIPLSVIRTQFPDHLQPISQFPFLAQQLQGDRFEGTLFRLPLRTSSPSTEEGEEENELPLGKILTPAMIRHQLEAWMKPQLFLFLRSIEDVACLQSGLARPLIRYHRQISPVEGSLKEVEAMMKATPQAGTHTRYQSLVQIQGEQHPHGAMSPSNFLVCQAFSNIHPEIAPFVEVSATRRRIPYGGVAFELSLKEKTIPGGTMYSTLPLPLVWKLPVIVNGRYELASNRRMIVDANDRSAGEDLQWNMLLTCHVIVPCYIRLLESLTQLQRPDADQFFYAALPPPLPSLHTSSSSFDHPLLLQDVLIQETWQRITSSSMPLWPYFTRTRCHFASLTDAVFCLSLPEELKEFLRRHRQPWVVISRPILQTLQCMVPSLAVAGPGPLQSWLNRVGWQDTYSKKGIKDVHEAVSLVMYCVQGAERGELCRIVPLCHNRLGWMESQLDGPVLLSTMYRDLLPSSLADLVIHEELWKSFFPISTSATRGEPQTTDPLLSNVSSSPTSSRVSSARTGSSLVSSDRTSTSSEPRPTRRTPRVSWEQLERHGFRMVSVDMINEKVAVLFPEDEWAGRWSVSWDTLNEEQRRFVGLLTRFVLEHPMFAWGQLLDRPLLQREDDAISPTALQEAFWDPPESVRPALRVCHLPWVNSQAWQGVNQDSSQAKVFEYETLLQQIEFCSHQPHHVLHFLQEEEKDPGTTFPEIRSALLSLFASLPRYHLHEDGTKSPRPAPPLPIFPTTRNRYVLPRKVPFDLPHPPFPTPALMEVQMESNRKVFCDGHQYITMKPKQWVRQVVHSTNALETISHEEYQAFLDFLITMKQQVLKSHEKWVRTAQGTLACPSSLYDPRQTLFTLYFGDQSPFIPMFTQPKYLPLYTGLLSISPDVIQALAIQALGYPLAQQQKCYATLLQEMERQWENGVYDRKAYAWIEEFSFFRVAGTESFVCAREIVHPEEEAYARGHCATLHQEQGGWKFSPHSASLFSFRRVTDTMVHGYLQTLVGDIQKGMELNSQQTADLQSILKSFVSLRFPPPSFDFLQVQHRLKIQFVSLKRMVKGNQSFAPSFYTKDCLVPMFMGAVPLISDTLQLTHIWEAWHDLTQNKTHIGFNDLTRLCQLTDILLSLFSRKSTLGASVPSGTLFPNKRLELLPFSKLRWPATTEIHVLQQEQGILLHPELLVKPRGEFFIAAGLNPLTDSGLMELLAQIPQDLQETEETRKLQKVLQSEKFLNTLLLLHSTADTNRELLQQRIARIRVRVMNHIRVRFGGKGAPIMDREHFIMEECRQPTGHPTQASLTANLTYFLFTKHGGTLSHALASLLREHLQLELSIITLEMLLLEDPAVETFVQEESTCVLVGQVDLGAEILPPHEDKLHWDWKELEEMEIVVYTETKPYRYAQVVGRERGEKDAPPRFLLEGLSRRILVTHRCFIAQIASCPTNETPPTAADVKSEFSRMWKAAEKKEEILQRWKEAKEAGPKAMKRAMREIWKEIHPDKNPGNQENAEILFKWFTSYVGSSK